MQSRDSDKELWKYFSVLHKRSNNWNSSILCVNYVLSVFLLLFLSPQSRDFSPGLLVFFCFFYVRVIKCYSQDKVFDLNSILMLYF